jgi:sulfonate transport system permease protein
VSTPTRARTSSTRAPATAEDGSPVSAVAGAARGVDTLAGAQPVAVQPVAAQPVAPPPVAVRSGSERARPGIRLLPGRWWKRLLSPLAVIAAWQLVSTFGIVSAQKLPPPTRIWSTAVSLTTTNSAAYGTLQGAMAVSLERMAIGFTLGAVVAVSLALIAGLSTLGENSVDPLMQMLRTVPLFGLIPVFIVWFGIGQLPKVLLIALGAAIPLYLNTFSGIRGIDAKLAELGKVLQLNKTELIRHIVLPGALPQALVGLRQSLGVAWLALVVAEQVNANAGLGYMISQATQFLQNNVIFVALLVYCVLGLLTDALVRMLERRALAWRAGFLEQ